MTENELHYIQAKKNEPSGVFWRTLIPMFITDEAKNKPRE
jgi:hypothetical protein